MKTDGKDENIPNMIDRNLLAQAVDNAEELVSEDFKFSEDFWKGSGWYELKTYAQLSTSEKVDNALAQLIKCKREPEINIRHQIFFKICLQEKRIMKFFEENRLELSTLLSYIMVHELIHVVRFARHEQLFEAKGAARLKEERIVHEITCQILNSISLHGLKDVISFVAPSGDGTYLEEARDE